MKKMITGMITGALIFTMTAGTTVWAAEITVDEAVTTALEKAGVTAEETAVYKRVWEFSDGKEQYDIHFLIPGQTKFEYEIDAVTGDILSGEANSWEADDDMEYNGLTVGEDVVPYADSDIVEEAVHLAIEDAGLKEGEAVVSKGGIDYENGKKIIDVGFFVAGQAKYDYDFDADTKEILERDQESWDAEDDLEYEGLINPGKATEAAAPGEITEADAAAIALKDAGLAESDVTVTECRKELDDGIEKFKVSFRSADGAEYEYDINATDGTILEKDKEYDDD